MEVNFDSLLIKDEKLDKNFYPLEINPELIPSFGHNDMINDWIIERVRRFNESSFFLIHSLQRMNVFGNLLQNNKVTVMVGDMEVPTIIEHRYACRDACINIEIYVEKIKSFCRYYFFMEEKATDNGIEWAKAILEYKSIENWEYIQAFLNRCNDLLKDKDYLFLKEVRNAEVHNESPFVLMNCSFEGPNLTVVYNGYNLDSGALHNQIVGVVSKLTLVTAALQNLLENIGPHDIRRYRIKQGKDLSRTVKMEERYKKERIRFEKYSSDKNK